MAHPPRPGATMGPAEWDARYAADDSIWGAEPNRYVRQHTGGLPPGRAVDLACGEGRNAIFLARAGWQVTAVDFSPVAIDKARRVERSIGPPAAPPAAGHPAGHPAPKPVTWICADAVDYRPGPVELALVIYVHLPAEARRQMLTHAASALVPSGRLLVVGHHPRNITDGVGGPQRPDILFGPDDIAADLRAVAPEMAIDVAESPRREVAGADRAAIDTVVLARRP